MNIKSIKPLTSHVRPIKITRPPRPGRQSITKHSMLAFLSTFALAQATVIEFDLSPTGTDNAVGLSPANETTPVSSSGSGNEISGGITFDTTTSTLTLAIGYGSSAGFTDLTGAGTALRIHGPALVGAPGGVLFDLAGIHFPAANPANGGIIFGSAVYSPAQAADLLAGSHYVNIHTSANSGGEIRGQLVPVLNVAPEVTGPATSTVESGVPVTYAATVSDADGDAVQVVWTLNGLTVQTHDIAAGGPPTNGVVEYTASLPWGVNTLVVTATDSFGNITTGTATITVVDTTLPVIVSVSVSPSVLWPHNHKMVPVQVSAVVTDAGGPTTLEILSISSNQAVDGRGSGRTSPDWTITGDTTATLRAERTGNSRAGRTYTITVQATDEAGNKSTPSTVTVTVPHNRR